MDRRLEPELLDELPSNDPRAAQSRRDLQRVNRCMGHAGILARALRGCGPKTGGRIVELGAGDGTLLLRAAQRLGRDWRGCKALLVDRQDLVCEQTLNAFKAIDWSVQAITGDVFDWMKRSSTEHNDTIVANLFLHHFTSEQLIDLLRLVSQRAQGLIAMEPRRGFWPLAFSRLLWFIGCNQVTRHDAVVSVRAGFRGTELSRLWPVDSQWSLTERPAGLFSHLFVATESKPIIKCQPSSPSLSSAEASQG